MGRPGEVVWRRWWSRRSSEGCLVPSEEQNGRSSEWKSGRYGGGERTEGRFYEGWRSRVAFFRERE